MALLGFLHRANFIVMHRRVKMLNVCRIGKNEAGCLNNIFRFLPTFNAKKKKSYYGEMCSIGRPQNYKLTIKAYLVKYLNHP